MVWINEETVTRTEHFVNRSPETRDHSPMDCGYHGHGKNGNTAYSHSPRDLHSRPVTYAPSDHYTFLPCSSRDQSYPSRQPRHEHGGHYPSGGDDNHAYHAHPLHAPAQPSYNRPAAMPYVGNAVRLQTQQERAPHHQARSPRGMERTYEQRPLTGGAPSSHQEYSRAVHYPHSHQEYREYHPQSSRGIDRTYEQRPLTGGSPGHQEYKKEHHPQSSNHGQNNGAHLAPRVKHIVCFDQPAEITVVHHFPEGKNYEHCYHTTED